MLNLPIAKRINNKIIVNDAILQEDIPEIFDIEHEMINNEYNPEYCCINTRIGQLCCKIFIAQLIFCFMTIYFIMLILIHNNKYELSRTLDKNNNNIDNIMEILLQ